MIRDRDGRTRVDVIASSITSAMPQEYADLCTPTFKLLAPRTLASAIACTGLHLANCAHGFKASRSHRSRSCPRFSQAVIEKTAQGREACRYSSKYELCVGSADYAAMSTSERMFSV